MASIVHRCAKLGLLNTPPPFLETSVQLEVIMGSVAYGVTSDTSDTDVYGFCIPSRDVVFPHLAGKIEGFGRPPPTFGQFQQHHIDDPEAGKQYDLCIYGIVKFFQLCMENNPNMVDALFVPRRCVLYSTPLGELVREHRQLFLSRAAWPKFKGYAYSQLHKARTKRPVGSRKAAVEQHGVDRKFLYHVVRLIGEVEQILATGGLDLEANREQLKAVRRGDWTLGEVEEYFRRKERDLESVYASSTLPYSADEGVIKALLLKCLETHYGSLDGAIRETGASEAALREIRAIVDRTL